MAGGVAVLMVGLACAAGDGWGEEDTEFFDFSEQIAAQEPIDDSKPSAWGIGGTLQTDWALWTERFADRPWAKARQSLDLNTRYSGNHLRLVAGLHAEYDLAYCCDRDAFDPATIGAYEWLIIPWEVYGTLAWPGIEFSVGRQIINWGEGDAISFVDAINPRDLREPGQVDLEDMRIPVLASRLSASRGRHRLELIALHEAYFGFLSPPLGPYGPFEALLEERADMTTLDQLDNVSLRYRHNVERFGAAAQQFLGRWNFYGEGVDLALFAASTRQQQGVFSAIDLETLQTANRIDLVLEHPRIFWAGHSGIWGRESWLFFWEGVYTHREGFSTGDFDQMPPVLNMVHRDTLSTLVGLRYGASTDHNVALEVGKKWLLDNEEDFLFPVDRPVWSLRGTHNLLRQRLLFTWAATVFGWHVEQGFLVRLTADYELADGVHVGVGYITYHPGDTLGPLSGFERHDRFWTKVRWDFWSSL